MIKLMTFRVREFAFLVMGVVCLFCVDGYARSDTHFYFVQITDTHFGEFDNLKRTEKIIEKINNLPMKIEFVAITGDIIDDENDSKDVVDAGLSLLKKINVPVHYVAGNNDIYPSKLEVTTKNYMERFGDLITQAKYQGVEFVFIFTEPLRQSFVMKGYDPLKQLKKILKKSKKKPVVVFHHAPSVDDLAKNGFEESWNKNTKEKWVKLLNDYNVKAVIAGHYHRDEYHWLGNVPLYVSAPVTAKNGRQATFRIYEYQNGKISYRTQYLEH